MQSPLLCSAGTATLTVRALALPTPCLSSQAKARKVDVNQRYCFDESLGVRVRTRRERKYSAAQLALARGSRHSRHAAACLQLAWPSVCKVSN